MKDQMYLYGFLVVTSIVALILSVLSLTKKDKFSDYVNLGVTSPMTDKNVAIVNSSPAETGFCFRTDPDYPVGKCSDVWGFGGGTHQTIYQMSNDEDMEVVVDDSIGTFKCRSKLKQSLTECCHNQKAATTTLLTSATTGAKQTVQCGSSDSPYYCYYDKGTNNYLCNDTPVPTWASLGECSKCFNSQNPSALEVLLAPSEKTNLKKGQFVNFYAKDSNKNKLYLSYNGTKLSVVPNKNTSADTQWYTKGLSASALKTHPPHADVVFAIIKKGIGAGEAGSSYLRGQMIAPWRSTINLPNCTTNSVDTVITQDFNKRFTHHLIPGGSGMGNEPTTKCYNDTNPWPHTRYCDGWIGPCGGNYAYRGACPADSGVPCQQFDYHANSLTSLTSDPRCDGYEGLDSTVNYDRYSWDISPDTDGKYYLMISIWDEGVDKPPTMSSQQWLLCNTTTHDVMLSPFPPSTPYLPDDPHHPSPMDRFSTKSPEDWVGFQWYNLSTVPQDMTACT